MLLSNLGDTLRGLWWSGLRLRDALSRSCDADGLMIDTSE
jgi:hypothetical protein